MKIHRLERSLSLPITMEQGWKFLSDPRNLQEITPPELGFTITSVLPDEMYAGLVISYKVTPLLGIPITWVSEITQVQRPHYFVDTQLIGPYRIWHHEHHLTPVEGGVEMKDIVNYSLGFSIFGEIAHKLFVERQLNKIFNFRQKVLESKFARV